MFILKCKKVYTFNVIMFKRLNEVRLHMLVLWRSEDDDDAAGTASNE